MAASPGCRPARARPRRACSEAAGTPATGRSRGTRSGPCSTAGRRSTGRSAPGSWARSPGGTRAPASTSQSWPYDRRRWFASVVAPGRVFPAVARFSDRSPTMFFRPTCCGESSPGSLRRSSTARPTSRRWRRGRRASPRRARSSPA